MLNDRLALYKEATQLRNGAENNFVIGKEEMDFFDNLSGNRPEWVENQIDIIHADQSRLDTRKQNQGLENEDGHVEIHASQADLEEAEKMANEFDDKLKQNAVETPADPNDQAPEISMETLSK